MPNYQGPADKADGQTLTGAEYNALINTLEDYLNNGGIGNAQFSSNPAERLAGTKVDLGGGVTAAVHAARHAPGGGDPLLPGSISASMLAAGALSDRREADAFLAKAFDIQFVPSGKRTYTHPNSNARPTGKGVVRGGKVYFACQNIDVVTEITPGIGTFVNIALSAGDQPNDLILIGTDIYVCCAGDGAAVKPKIKRIDAANVVTTICDITTDGAAKIATATRMHHLIPHPLGDILYAVVGVGGSAVCRHLVRISTTIAAGVLHSFDAGAAGDLFGLSFVQGASTGAPEFLVMGDNQAGNTTVRKILAADLTGAASVTTLSATNVASSALYDGGLFVIREVGVVAALRIYDIGSPTAIIYEVLNAGIPTNTPAPGTAPTPRSQPPFFDGRACYFPSDTTLSTVIVVPAGRYTGAFNVRISGSSARFITGMASDGDMMWFAMCNGAVSNAEFVHVLLG